MKLAPILALAVAAVLPLRAAELPPKPNIVVIFIDDMGYGDIGPYGATKQRTPNLDRMAKEGMKLTSFYAAPVCSVSRAQLLTGCYGARVSVPGVFPPGHGAGLNPAEFTIAERLKELGYATACIGKWHVGDQPEFLPRRQGFDHYLGIPYSNDMLRKSREKGVPVVPLVRDDAVEELLTDEAQSGLVARYTDEAVAFIRASQNKPFLLYLPHNAVHTPIHPGPAFAGKSQNGRFGDWVEEVDWSVGRVLDTLRELKLDRKTLVIFTSDNGPWQVKGHDAGSAGPLRGGKGSTWEGGVREPTLAWWPGVIAADSTCDAVAGTIDLLPTAVSLAGGTVPAEPVIDGRDITPLLTGASKESPREAHYYFRNYELQAVRQGPWKLALVSQSLDMGSNGLADAGNKGQRLYNLDADIGERTDVAVQHPEVVAKLRALAERMSAEIGGTNPAARRPAGTVANPRMLYDGDEHKPAKAAKQPAALNRLKSGATLAAEAAPQVARRSFTISFAFETAQTNAVLVAHGGASIGYSIFLRDGRVHFAVREGTQVYEAAAAEPARAGRVVASLAADGGMKLAVGDQPLATGKAPGTLARQPQEDFCVGFDNRVPVVDGTTADRFEGRLKDLAVSVSL